MFLVINNDHVCFSPFNSQTSLAHMYSVSWKHDAQTVVHDNSTLILQGHFFPPGFIFPFRETDLLLSKKCCQSGTHTSPDKLRIKFSSVVIYWSLRVASFLKNLISQNKATGTNPRIACGGQPFPSIHKP